MSRIPTSALCLAFIVVACGSSADTPDAAARDSGKPDAALVYERVPESVAAEGRSTCRFSRGAMPWETIGEEFPIGGDLPIDHIVMIMQENRSFDHYFGTMPGVDGIPEGASNPDAEGRAVFPYHEARYCIEDVAHGWNDSHAQYNGGANDGFVTTNDPDGERALGYLDGGDLPFYWDLYGTFAMSDHHHCSVLGPTWVNRYYYMSGTSFGLVRNDPAPDERLTEPYVIFQQLDGAGIDYRVYNSDVPFVLAAYARHVGANLRNVRPMSEFYRALAEGTLPAVSYVDPSFIAGVDRSDEHPPANPQAGQAFVEEVVTAAFASPLWSRMAIVLTYDEHGGFYDHVPPPAACPPGDHPPDRRESDVPADFDRLGFRVPLAVVSPYSRPGYVSDRVTDLSSVLRFVQARFLLPALTSRDANAWPLLDMFDFEEASFATPPELAPAVIDEEKMEACRREFPGSRLDL